MFKGDILDTTGEVKGLKKGLMNSNLKVHKLKEKKTGERLIGLEIIHKSGLAFQMTPISLSRDEARKLKNLIEETLQD